MFDRIRRRVVSLWFSRLASERVLRRCPVKGPFVLTLKQQSANLIYCLNAAATQQGMTYADARAFCSNLQNRNRIQTFFVCCAGGPRVIALGLGWRAMTRWYTGSTHLFGGEKAMLADMCSHLMRVGLSVRSAWRLRAERPGPSRIMAKGVPRMARLWLLISDLPVAALRIDELMSVALQRLGLRSTGNLAQATRAPLNRRFRAVLLRRLDQALGDQPEEISPHSDRPHYTVHMPLATGRATGPEHIAYKWWLDDDNWRSGLRDYWRVKTTQGRQLWLFYTPQNPGWFLQGEFA